MTRRSRGQMWGFTFKNKMLASSAPEYKPQARAAMNGSDPHIPHRRELASVDDSPSGLVRVSSTPHLSQTERINVFVITASSQHAAHTIPSSHDSTMPPQTRHSCG